MEYCPGGSLADRLAGTPLPPDEAATFVETLARTMHVAHERGIVHRDLKPANVLLSNPTPLPPPRNGEGERGKPPPRNGEGVGGEVPKITDFGLAKRLDEPGQTSANAIMGTPSYMAPEQACGDMKRIGPATDVYALGAILYECLTGRPPFKASSAAETLLQALHDDPPPPSQLQPRLPRDIETICLTCLRKDPQKRYPSARALADDLRRFLNHEPIHARPTPSWERAAKWVRRRPLVATLLALVVLVTAAGFALVSWQWQRAQSALERESDALGRVKDALGAEAAERNRAETALRLERAQNYYHRLALAEREWQANNIDRADAILDACPGDLRHWEWRYLKHLCHVEERLLRGHESSVGTVAFSPDGRWIASGSSLVRDKKLLGEVKVWDATTGQEYHAFRDHDHIVESVAFSPDSRWIVASVMGGTVKILDAQQGEVKHSFQPVQEGNEFRSFRRGALDPTGRYLALAIDLVRDRRNAGGEMRVWDLQDNRAVFTAPISLTEASALAFSPDGKLLAVAGRNDRGPGPIFQVRLWDAVAGKELRMLPGRTCVAFSSDSKRLAAAADDYTVRVWDTTGGQERLVCRGHGSYVSGVAFSPDGKILASGSWDKTVKQWDAQTGKEIATFRGHSHWVSGVAFHPNGQFVASAGSDRTVRLWDVTHPPEMRVFRLPASQGRGVVFTARGDRMAFVQTDKTIDVSGGIGEEEGVARPGGKRVDCVKVWEAGSHRELHSVARAPWSAAFSPDGRTLAVGDEIKRVTLWDLEKKSSRELLGHTDAVYSVAFNPAGDRLASAGKAKTIRLWEIASGHEVLPALTGHTDVVWCVCFTPDGTRLASASWDGTAKLWDAATGKELRTLRGHKDQLFALTASPDGALLATAGVDRVVRLWDLRPEADPDGGPLRELAGHMDSVCDLAFSADGKRLASASKDRTVKLWDAQLGQEVFTLRGHLSKVTGVAFSPDGRTLATTGEDATLRLWEGVHGE
jgi:WD40 repeat protein